MKKFGHPLYLNAFVKVSLTYKVSFPYRIKCGRFFDYTTFTDKTQVENITRRQMGRMLTGQTLSLLIKIQGYKFPNIAEWNSQMFRVPHCRIYLSLLKTEYLAIVKATNRVLPASCQCKLIIFIQTDISQLVFCWR